ncbi:MAG: hypothetical protein V1799_05240 [bacterium]
MQTAQAYFDGKYIQLKEPLDLKPFAQLLVTVLTSTSNDVTKEEIEAAALEDLQDDDFLSQEELSYYLSLS